jgi:hypothetical protein
LITIFSHFHKLDESGFEVCRVAAVLADGCSETLYADKKKGRRKGFYVIEKIA